MKTLSLATALHLAFAVAFAPAVLAQDTQTQAPAAEAPAAEAPAAEAPAVEAPAAEAPQSPEAEAQAPAADTPAETPPETGEPVAAFAMPDLPIIGVPVPGGTGYQPAVTEVAHDMHWLSHMVHTIMVLIVALVTVLLAMVVLRFNRRANPEPARFTHNTKLEIAWTLGPVLILIVIGSFSLPILFKQLEIPDPQLTVKATGNQWYWNYEYPDNEFSYDSLLLPREDLEAAGYTQDLYLLAADTALVVPVGEVVKLQTTGADVIHSWAMPAFGVKIDAVPGRLNETWFRVEEPGIYFGQCSELCGKDHAFMPIVVKALEPEDYAAWLDWAIDEYGGVRGEADVAATAAPAN
ncbi:cytochrome c oxidase subunit II [Amaricoccus sp.]|uniref:cytochrome c oxidase subunit II n=1 Tax=Amaricoccus sp. TaxID=1872485 RepID=UPI00345C9B81